MANVIRLKRRPAAGSAGAPASLKTAEPAYNEADDTLYVGFGDNGSGEATSVRAIAGAGTFATKQYADQAAAAASVADGAKGDITVSNSGATFTIVNGVVTNAKLAPMGNGTIKGRATAGSGAPEDLTPAQIRSIINVADGANNYVHPTGDGNLHVPATGTTNNGRFLKAGATAGALSWADVTYSDLGGAVPTWNQNTTGSAAKLTTPRTINLTGPVTGSVSFDGSGNVSMATTVADAELAAIAAVTSAANKIPYFTGPGAAGLLTLDTDANLAANSDAVIATQKAIKSYVDARIVSNDAMVFKGVIDCNNQPDYPAANNGWTYRVSAVGRIGGAGGVNVDVGDMLICLVDGSPAGIHTSVGANWAILQANIDGALTTWHLGAVVQEYSVGLTSLGELATAANKGLYLTGVNEYATFDLTAAGRSLGGLAGTINSIPYFSAAGVASAFGSTLAGRNLLAVAGTANTFPYFATANNPALATITAQGRALLDDVDAAAQRATMGLGTMATQAANNVAITGGTIDGVVIDGGTF